MVVASALVLALAVVWAVWTYWASGAVLFGGSGTTAPPVHRVAERVLPTDEAAGDPTALIDRAGEGAAAESDDERGLRAGDATSGGQAEDGTARSTEPEAAPTPVADLAAVQVEWQPVARAPLPITGDVDPATGHVWIGQQGGQIRILGDDGLSEPVLDLSSRTDADGERGLLGMAFDTDGSRLYVHFTDLGGDTQLVEFDVSLVLAGAPGEGRTVLSVDQPRGNHNGGDVVFGPDGFLYLALGDGGGAGDRQGNAQNNENLLGTIVRIDPTGGDPYAVPVSNPFAGGAGAERPEIWAFGLRNPFRVSFDDDGSLWIGDVGQNAWEEVSVIPPKMAGANLGWNLVEGDASFDGGSADGLAGYVGPVFVYPTDDPFCSVIGGHVYRGSAIPALWGSYVYGDYCEQQLRAFEIDDPSTERLLGLTLPGGPTGFVETADRELLALTQGGEILKLVPAG